MDYIYDAYCSFQLDSSSPYPLSLYEKEQLAIDAKQT